MRRDSTARLDRAGKIDHHRPGSPATCRAPDTTPDTTRTSLCSQGLHSPPLVGPQDVVSHEAISSSRVRPGSTTVARRWRPTSPIRLARRPRDKTALLLQPSLSEARLQVALDTAQQTWPDVFTRMNRHGRHTPATFDARMRASLPAAGVVWFGTSRRDDRRHSLSDNRRTATTHNARHERAP